MRASFLPVPFCSATSRAARLSLVHPGPVPEFLVLHRLDVLFFCFFVFVRTHLYIITAAAMTTTNNCRHT